MDDQDQLKQLADVISTWHANKKKAFNDIIDSTDNGKPLKLELNDTNYELADDKLKGFRVGMIAALALLGNLPFTLERTEIEVEEEDDEELDEEPGPRPPNFGHFS